jgi:hypothetical protein
MRTGVSQFGLGDLVEYEFKTLEGKLLKVGLVISHLEYAGEDACPVYGVRGFDGETYSIHHEYLKLINKGASK